MTSRFIPQFEPYVSEKYIDSVSEQMRTGWVGPGKKVEEFERKISEFYNSSEKPFVSATTSGTAALILAIESLEIPKGSTILFPAYTFLAGANAARFLGYNIELVDIKENTLCMDPDKIKFNNNVKAVIFVN